MELSRFYFVAPISDRALWLYSPRGSGRLHPQMPKVKKLISDFLGLDIHGKYYKGQHWQFPQKNISATGL
jgi:hypothetical protein